MGAWARCLHCREEANKAKCRTGLPALHVTSDTDSKRECKDDEGVQCSKCGKCRPYDFYPASAIKNSARNKVVVCNVCQKLTRCDRCLQWKRHSDFRTARGTRLGTCKACMGIICAACGETKATDQFAQKCVGNCLTHGQNVSCTACRAEGKMPKAYIVRCNSHTSKVCSACTVSKPAFSS